MPTPRAKPITLAEAKTLFADFKRLPALVLAVSGGPDSTALMVLAARWRAALKGHKPKLIAVTVDHGLRKELKREAAQAAQAARKLGIAHRTLRWTGSKPKTGLQQAARAARYRLLAQAARKLRASHVLTAHTLDDQAETVLIRMARGSGLTGLAAMQRLSTLPYRSPERGGSIAPTGPREARPDDRLRAIGVGSNFNETTPTRRAKSAFTRVFDALWRADLPLAGGGMGASGEGAPITLARPLLDIPKTRLIATLEAAKIPYAEDPSNRDPRFTRARLRGLMGALAAEGLSAARLAQLARRLQRAERALTAAAARAEAELESARGGIGCPGVRRYRLGAAARRGGAAAARPGGRGHGRRGAGRACQAGTPENRAGWGPIGRLEAFPAHLGGRAGHADAGPAHG